MLTDERRQQILRAIEERGFASLAELSQKFPASDSTLRRDLEHLDRIGQIRRTRGGAAYVGESLTPFEERTDQHVIEKRRIATAVSEIVQPGDTLLLDGGTTTLEVAKCLTGRPLSVVTNSLPIATLLVNRPEIELIFIGGYLYPRTGVALGPIAETSLAAVRVRRLIMSVGGLTEQGMFNSNSLVVETERRMIEAADEVIVATDSSKFGRAALARIAPLEIVDTIVTDVNLGDEWLKICERESIRVTTV